MFTGNSPGMDHAHEVAVKDSVFRDTPFAEDDFPDDRDRIRVMRPLNGTRHRGAPLRCRHTPSGVEASPTGSGTTWPQPAISDRADVSAAVLDARYDE